jgi:TonB family protein
MKTLRPLILLPAVLFAAAPLFSQFAAREYVPMSYIETEPAVFPQSVITLGLMSGDARVSIQVDDKGALTDYLAVAYTHPAFYDAAVNALKSWKFKPALIHGFSRSATAILDFSFRTEGVVVSLTTNDIPEVVHYRITPGSQSYRACTLRDLDKIPTPTKIVKPVYTTEQARRSHVRHVTVEFYIDEQGRVRQPAVARQTDEADEELCAAAITAVEQWQFEAPVSRGRPVLVLVQQDFDFKAAPAAGSDAAAAP